METKKKFFSHYREDVNKLSEILKETKEEKWKEWGYSTPLGFFTMRNEDTIPFIFMVNGCPPWEFKEIKYFKQDKILENIVVPMGERLAKYLNGTIIKLIVCKIDPDAFHEKDNIKTKYTHIDLTDTLQLIHRVHMPIVMPTELRYHVDGEEFAMNPGYWYEKNNIVPHQCYNYAEVPDYRYTMHCDIFPHDDSFINQHPDLYYENTLTLKNLKEANIV